MRSIEEVPLGDLKGRNSLNCWHKTRNPLRLTLNLIVIELCRFLPSISLKRALYRTLGMKIGKNTAFAYGAMCDFFFPELIEVGENCIIGYNATLLTHEFLTDKCNKGKIEIGDNVLIGANCTVLPGVKIGENTKVSAMSLVNSDLPPNCLAGGMPAKVIRVLQ